MLTTLAVSQYRSIYNLVIELGQLNLVTGANASGKSNLYRALRLLAETARGGVVSALAHEGGLKSALWAGPRTISRAVKSGEVDLFGMKGANQLKLGFASNEFSYAITLEGRGNNDMVFPLDPIISTERIWAGELYRPASVLAERQRAVVRVREGKGWNRLEGHQPPWASLFDGGGYVHRTPEILALRDTMYDWRFYDHFRTDRHSPVRQPQLGTRTPVLHQDGHDLAAALATIRAFSHDGALDQAIDDAFPGALLSAGGDERGFFSLSLMQPGLMRALSAAEMSDGTLRYLLWIAALLTPQPPALMVLNEPETSLHPDLLPALARLIIRASAHTQVLVVSHASRLIAALEASPACHCIELEKEQGQTTVRGQGILDGPVWRWQAHN